MTRYRFAIAALAICSTASSFAVAHEPSAKSVVEKRFAAVRRHDIEAIVALYAPDAIETSPGFCHARSGPDGARQTYTDLFRTFPDITDDEITYVVEGDRVAVQFFARIKKADGTHAFEMPLANFITVKHGLITRDDTYFGMKGPPCN